MLMIFLGQNAFAKSTFSSERLAKGLRDFIATQVQGDVEVEVSPIEEQRFDQPNITARFNAPRESLRGRTNIIIEFLAGESVIRRIQVAARIRFYAEVPSAAEPIRRGEELQENSVATERKEITSYKDGELPLVSELVGRRAAQNIQKGTIINRLMIEKQKLIHRGERIAVIAESGCVRVRTSGESLQDGAAGDRVRFKRDGSQSIFSGKVAPDGTVVVTEEDKK